MFCGKCGTENTDGAKFCKNCGEPLRGMERVQETKKAALTETDMEHAAVAGSVSNVQQADAGQPGGKDKAFPKAVLAGICAAAAVAVICIVLNMGTAINLNDYMTVGTEGCDGYGTANVSIDWEAIEEKYGDKISFTGNARDEYGGLIKMMTPMEVLRDYVKVTLDRPDGLSNGDKITYMWNVDEGFSKYVDCKIKYKDGAYEVSGLTEVGTFDAFADLEVTFTGVGPDGRAELGYNGNELDVHDFICDKDSGLSNGDTVKVSIDTGRMEDYARNLGKIPEVSEKEYTVEGLSSYVTKLSEISAEGLASMQQQASDVYHAHVAQEWSDSSTLEGFAYIGAYLLTIKKPDPYRDNNALYLVYKVQARNSYSNGADAYDKVNGLYWYISFKNLMLDTEGKLTADMADYRTPSATFTVDSGISSGWFSTQTWYYEGYGALPELYDDVVTSNMDFYNHEDNVDEGMPAADGSSSPKSEKTEKLDAGYILPDSGTKLLTEADLEGLSAEECKIARNEIYARHGRKFTDGGLQAHFDACGWYKGTIEPDDFEESMLSEIEMANRDLIVAYEEKHNFY